MSQKLVQKGDVKSGKEHHREENALRKGVSLPLANIPLKTITFYISIALLLYITYSAYLMKQWKNEAGGWMNLALGRTPPAEPTGNAVPFGSEEDESKHATAGELLENRIQELANQLGIEPTELASAIKTLVHPTKASALYGSVGSEPTENSGNIVDVLTEDEKAQEGMENPNPFAWMDTVVGLDDLRMRYPSRLILY